MVERLRRMAGLEALSDDHLRELIGSAEATVERDVARLHLRPSSSDRLELVLLKAAEYGARLVRTPEAEAAGGLSVKYIPFSWGAEYAKALTRLARSVEPQGGML